MKITLLSLLLAILTGCNLNTSDINTNKVKEINMVVEDFRKDIYADKEEKVLDVIPELPSDCKIQDDYKEYNEFVYDDKFYGEGGNGIRAIIKTIEVENSHGYKAIESFEELKELCSGNSIEIYVNDREVNVLEYFNEKFFENNSLIIHAFNPGDDDGKIEKIGQSGNSLNIIKLREHKVENDRDFGYVVYGGGIHFLEVDKTIENVYIDNYFVVNHI